MSSKPLGVERSMRLRRRQDFLAVQRASTKIHGKAFLALVAPTAPLARSETTGRVGRVGVTVTRRVGNAVTRNRIKRFVREWLRQHGWVPAGNDVVFVAKEAAAGLRRLEDVGADLARLCARLSVVKAPSC